MRQNVFIALTLFIFCAICVYFPDEEDRGEEANGAGDEPEGDGDDDSVDKIDQGGYNVVDVDFRVEVEDAVSEHVNCGGSHAGQWMTFGLQGKFLK